MLQIQPEANLVVPSLKMAPYPTMPPTLNKKISYLQHKRKFYTIVLCNITSGHLVIGIEMHIKILLAYQGTLIHRLISLSRRLRKLELDA